MKAAARSTEVNKRVGEEGVKGPSSGMSGRRWRVISNRGLVKRACGSWFVLFVSLVVL